MQPRPLFFFSSGLRRPSEAMESTKNGAHLPQEDATLLAFSRRRKKLIAIFSAFLISLALIIAALITFLIHDSTVPETSFDPTTTVDPSLHAFCSVVRPSPSCLASFDPIIYTKPVKSPNQIFTLSLETAAEELVTLISLLSNSTDRSNLSGCSDSLGEALNQINGTFSLVDQLQRYRVMNRIVAAEEALQKACSADGSVERAKRFLGYSRDFLSRYDDVWMAKYYWKWHLLRRELEDNAFVIVMFGLQLLFLGFLVCSVLRIH